jgi:hypothetical protein
MKKLATALFAVSLSAATAYAGGPVVVDDEVEAVVERPGSSMGILPIIIIGVALCAVLCGQDDEDRPPV